MPRELYLRLRAWMQRDRLQRELEAEMRMHAELLARDLEHEGVSPDQATVLAKRQLGNTTGQREASRDAWGFPALDALLGDVRYAVRGLVRSPAFTVTVVVTLALGIGANAAMFAVIDRLMFRPLPYMKDPGTAHLVYLQITNPQGRTSTYSTTPYTRHRELERYTSSFAQTASISEWRFAVGRGVETRIRKVAAVSANMFAFFDAAPVLGRFFVPREDVTPIGAMVAVLSHGYWSTELGSRDVLGETIHIGALDFTIIGVAPPGFVGASEGRAPDIFIPITTAPALLDPGSANTYWLDHRWDWTELLVRRKPGVSVEVANADLTAAFRRSRAIQRETNPRVMPDSVARPTAIAGSVRGAAGPGAGDESRILLWVQGVAAVVLLIACANVANLMLARALRRRREIAVRLALGVSRRRLVFQFLTEGLVLALLAAAAGLAVAQWGGIAIRAMLLPEGSAFNLATDWRTIGIAAACAVAAAVLTALAPAALVSRSNLSGSLKAGAREGGYRSSRARSTLLVAQAALSVVLLVGAGLFVRSLNNVLDIPLGFDASQVLEITSDFRGATLDSAASVAARRRLLEATQAVPGVVAAARVNSSLFRTNTTSLRVAGIDSVERLGRFSFQLTTPDYFEVLGTRILRGRGFDARDRAGAPWSAVVSQSMARALWPGKDAIGQCMEVSFGSAPPARPACTTVIGIAEDAAFREITDEQRFMYYLSTDQVAPGGARTILARVSSSDVDAEAERVRRAVQAAMPGDGFVIVRPLAEMVDNQRSSWTLGATLFATFGILALIVAAVGLYGVIGYDVAQRRHELGVRVALGARTGNIMGLVTRQGLALAAGGAAIGLAIALFVAPWLQPLLYKHSARDPWTYAAVALAMLFVAVVACVGPATRAARADPARALRAD